MDARKACEILKVELSDSLEKIKKSYKTLSLKCHPDRKRDNKEDQSEFIQLKKAYDYMVEFNKCNTSFSVKKLPLQPEPNEVDLWLTLEEISKGGTKLMQIERKIIDRNGNATSEKAFVSVHFEAGSLQNTRITVPQQGDKLEGQIQANVIFIVKQVAHKLFKRAKFDIEYLATISFSEAAIGCKLQVPCLAGGSIELDVPGVITKNLVKRIANKGLPYPPNANKFGDLVVRFDIVHEQNPPVEHKLFVTLEEIYMGCIKRVKIRRKVRDDSGKDKYENKLFNITIKPGTKPLTRFIFSKCGDQSAYSTPADIVFVIHDKPHSVFRRDGANIVFDAQISRKQMAENRTAHIMIPTFPLQNCVLPIPLSYFKENYSTKFCDSFSYSYKLKHFGNLVVNLKITENDRFGGPLKERELLLSLNDAFSGCTKESRINFRTINSRGSYKQTKTIKIEVKPGTQTGTRFIFPRIAMLGYRKVRFILSHIVFIVKEKQNALFKRIGDNILHTALLTKAEAKNGCQIAIPTLDDDILYENVSQNTGMRVFPRYGLPLYDEPDKRGNLVVRIKVVNDDLKDAPIERSLLISLEHVLFGALLQATILRTVLDCNGDTREECKTFGIKVPPGVIAGSRFIFPREGSQAEGRIPADVVFIATDQPCPFSED